MKCNNRIIPKLQRYTALITVIIFTVFAFGCSIRTTLEFPTVSFSQISKPESKSSEQSDQTVVSSGTLKVALPISRECLQYLSLMYVGDLAGLFHTIKPKESGLTVSLETLDTYNVGLNTSLQTISPLGISNEELSVLTASNALPDIMLINSNTDYKSNGFNSAIFNNSSLNQYLNPGAVFPSMLQYNESNGHIEKLPYYASVKMLFANEEMFAGISVQSLLPTDLVIDFNDVQSISKRITKTTTGIYGFSGLADLLAYFPPAVDPSSYSFMWDGSIFKYNDSKFSDSISAIKAFGFPFNSLDYLTDAQKILKYGNSDPRSTNKIGFWVDDSYKLEDWKLAGIKSLRRFPLQYKNQTSIFVSLYSIVVNSKSKLVNDALRFATFLTLDSNAILFRSRYSNPAGFISPLNNKIVWGNIVKPQLQGDELYQLFDLMNVSKSLVNKQESQINGIYQDMYRKYFQDILFGKKSYSTFAKEIDIEANKALNG